MSAPAEDPLRHLNYLQQCLSSDKKPLGFLIGAGCPMAIRGPQHKPLIPDITGITRLVCDELTQCPECAPLFDLIDDHFRVDCKPPMTVETLLSHIRALRAVAGNASVRGLTTDNLDRLDARICDLIHSVVNTQLPDNGTPYHNLAQWVDAVRRDTPVEVFTTNYDLLMEQAFETARVPYFDGFAGVCEPFFDLRAMEEDMLPSRWARLWKLHGSINWFHDNYKGVYRAPADKAGQLRRVIHPSHLKYQESRRMPYLAMIDRLRAFLGRPTATLVVCGYSFGDEHINEIVIQGLRSTPSAIVFALLYGDIAKYPTAVGLACKQSNLSLLALDGAVIGGIEAIWPERQAGSAASGNATWVTWKDFDAAGGTKMQKAQLHVGDFSVLGRFLSELAGRVQSTYMGGT